MHWGNKIIHIAQQVLRKIMSFSIKWKEHIFWKAWKVKIFTMLILHWNSEAIFYREWYFKDYLNMFPEIIEWSIHFQTTNVVAFSLSDRWQNLGKAKIRVARTIIIKCQHQIPFFIPTLFFSYHLTKQKEKYWIWKPERFFMTER